MPPDPHTTLTIEDDRWCQLLVDGELSSDDQVRFLARVQGEPAIAARVESHRRLRHSIEQSICPTQVSDELRARIASLVTAEERDIVARIGLGLPAPLAMEAPAKKSIFLGPRRASFAAVAATIMLISGVIAFSILGPTINQNVSHRLGVSMTDVASHVLHEHNRCSEDPIQRAQKAPFRTAERAYTELSAHVGHPVEIIDLRAIGYEFCCAGFCRVPGAESDSGHIMYRKAGSAGAPDEWVSLFVAPAEVPYHAVDIYGRPVPLQSGELFSESPGNDSFRNPSERIFGWTDGSLTYFLKVTSAADAASVIGELAPQFQRIKPMPKMHDSRG